MRVDQRQALATLGKPRLQELAAAFEVDAPTAALKRLEEAIRGNLGRLGYG